MPNSALLFESIHRFARMSSMLSLSNEAKEELNIVIFSWTITLIYCYFIIVSLKRCLPSELYLCAMIWCGCVLTQLRMSSSYFSLDEGLKWTDIRDYVALLDMSTKQLILLVIFFGAIFHAAKRYDDAVAAKIAPTSSLQAVSLLQVIRRNVCFLIILELLNSTFLAIHDCPNKLISREPVFTSIIPRLLHKFPLYHPSDYLLVRLSHTFAILNDVMRVTRTKVKDFVIWYAIYYTIGEAIGDLAHYVDDVDLADDRKYFDEHFACSIDTHFLREVVVYTQYLCLPTSVCNV